MDTPNKKNAALRPQAIQLTKIEEMRSTLLEAEKKYGGFHHPKVLDISQQLDSLIVEFCRNMEATS